MASMTDTVAAALAFDRRHLWHPYSSALTPGDPFFVGSARGIQVGCGTGMVALAGDRRHVSSWWCTIQAGMPCQLDAAPPARRTSHVMMFGGLTHGQPSELGRRRPSRPNRSNTVFFADSGSVLGRGRDEDGATVPSRGGRAADTFTVRSGYHGDTLSHRCRYDRPVGGMHSLFAGVLPGHV